jgi:hypothetical protein
MSRSLQAQRFLAERGLNDSLLLERCGIVELSSREMKEATGIGWQALRILYTSDFARYRFLPGGEHEATADNPAEAQLPSIEKKSDGSKPSKKRELQELRYWQPRHSGVHLYLPPLMDWTKVMADRWTPLIIAEGEFKAIAACHVLKMPACGIGGVWNWQPRKGLILPEFEQFVWRDADAPPWDFGKSRTVYIVFDSDVRRRSDLLAARDALVWQLTDRGADVRIINLPEKVPKVGLDDFLRTDPDGWGVLVAESAQSPNLKVFMQLNQTWAMLDSEPGFVIRLSDGKVVGAKRFQDAVSPIQLFRGAEKLNAGHEWMNWSRPRTVAREIFLPHPIGESPAAGFVELYEGEYCYNHWRGWPTSPASAVDNEAIQIYQAVRDWLFADQCEVVWWLERWIAHKLLYPIVKQPNIPIVIGDQGCGKDTYARFYTALFGAHGDHIPGTRIDSRFNGFMGHKLFLNISELEDASPQFFKDLVSNKVEFIERKRIDAVTGPSYLQLFATTNERVPYLMKADDRRGGIFRACKGKTQLEARIDTKLVEKIENLIAEPKNLTGIYPYFIKLDLSKYNPFGEPYHTDDKDDLIRQHRSDSEQFIYDVISNPDDYWVYINSVGKRAAKGCDLAAVQDFAYLPDAPPSLHRLLDDRRGLTTIGKWLGEILERGTVNRGQPVRTPHGRRRLWPVRNAGRWYQAKHDEIARHYFTLEIVEPVRRTADAATTEAEKD